MIVIFLPDIVKYSDINLKSRFRAYVFRTEALLRWTLLPYVLWLQIVIITSSVIHIYTGCIYIVDALPPNIAFLSPVYFTVDGKACNILYIIHYIHRQSKRSAQLPQPTRSQTGKPEETEFRPQSNLVSLSDNLPIVQVRDTLSRMSYQSIVLASLWWRIWLAAAN